MSSSVKLTVICVFSEAHLIETTLTSVYELKETPFELIIVNDGAGPEASTIIQSLTEYYDHDETFFFEYDLTAGEGARVNEVLQTITGNYIWIANSLGRIDEAELLETLEELHQSDAVVATVLPELPNDLTAWLDLIDKAYAEERLGFIWKWTSIPSNLRFFDPYLFDSTSFELIWRLGECPNLPKSTWFASSVEEQETENWAIKRELVLHFLRNFQLDNSLKEHLIQILSSTDDEANQKVRTQGESFLDRAREEYAKGNYVRASNYAREAYQKEPQNDVIRTYYLELLKYLGRQVEADEVRSRFDIPSKPKESTKVEPIIEEANDLDDDENDLEFRKQLHEFTSSIDDEKDEIDEIIEEEEDERPIRKVVVPTERAPEEILDAEIPENLPQYDVSKKIRYSVVVPTTGYGVELLQDFFERFMNVVDRDITEFILVDNASLDDTFSYLEDLKAKNFFRLEIITNSQNKGFAASVNQGIEKAKGEYVLIIHNDCLVSVDILHELEQLFIEKEDIGVAVPMLSYSLVDEQDVEHCKIDRTEKIVSINQCDSVCMMIKKSAPYRFDEVFGLAYFEDFDFCQQILAAGKKVYLHTQVEVEHRYGSSTSMLGISIESDYYALNMSKFNKKWGFEPSYDPKYNQLQELDRALVITSMMNPVDPEMHLFEEFRKNFTDEVKTQIIKTEWDEEYALAITSMLIKTDQREILRKFEVQLERFDLPISHVKQLVQYYFDRNIYSRCIHYLSIYGNNEQFPEAALFQLKIYIADRQIEEAAELINQLYQVFPANPEIYKLLGDLNQFLNNMDEAKQYHALANQIDPFRFGKPKGSASFI